MCYDSGWLLARQRRAGALWRGASAFVLLVVGVLAKIVMGVLNSTTVYNGAALRRAVRSRPRARALLTVGNHRSCGDDPGLWAVLDWCTLLRWWRLRWTLTAHDVCFTNALYARFFALGKCVPVVRGAGVHQPAIDFCIERLSAGEWVHIFPEGRVNVDKEHIRFKWGVGRLVAACSVPPLIVPVWHEGMDRVLPNHDYRLRVGERVVVNIGEPIQIQHILDRLKQTNASEEETRRAITEHIQDEMLRLRERTHALMRRAAGPPADRRHSRAKPSERDSATPARETARPERER